MAWNISTPNTITALPGASAGTQLFLASTNKAYPDENNSQFQMSLQNQFEAPISWASLNYLFTTQPISTFWSSFLCDATTMAKTINKQDSDFWICVGSFLFSFQLTNPNITFNFSTCIMSQLTAGQNIISTPNLYIYTNCWALDSAGGGKLFLSNFTVGEPHPVTLTQNELLTAIISSFNASFALSTQIIAEPLKSQLIIKMAQSWTQMASPYTSASFFNLFEVMAGGRNFQVKLLGFAAKSSSTYFINMPAGVTPVNSFAPSPFFSGTNVIENLVTVKPLSIVTFDSQLAKTFLGIMGCGFETTPNVYDDTSGIIGKANRNGSLFQFTGGFWTVNLDCPDYLCRMRVISVKTSFMEDTVSGPTTGLFGIPFLNDSTTVTRKPMLDGKIGDEWIPTNFQPINYQSFYFDPANLYKTMPIGGQSTISVGIYSYFDNKPIYIESSNNLLISFCVFTF